MNSTFYPRKMIINTMIFSLFLAFSFLHFPSIQAQVYVTNGSASHIGGTEYQLTPALNSQGGSVWFQNNMDLSSDFNIQVQLYFGTKDGSGADGIAFVLQPVCNGIGGIGGGIGYFGISPSFAVEYDTWQNADPPEDHMSIQRDGNLSHAAPFMLVPAVHTLPNIEDGVWHSSVLTWTAGTQTFTVSFDGNPIFSYTGDIVTNIFGGISKVFWGFTAATGGANNDHRVRINNVSFVESTPFSVTDATCPSSSDGEIDMMISGGASPYTYSWDDGPITEDRTGLLAGTYEVEVTDANGCLSTYSIDVGFIPDAIDPTILCPANILVNNDPGMCGAVVTYTPPAISDNCGYAPATLPGYTYLGSLSGSEYYLSDAIDYSANARNAAVALGGHLASITSAAENSFIAAATSPNHVWVGYSDRVIEGDFIWETGENPLFENWLAGEPNNAGNEDFTVINFSGVGLWNDENNAFTRRWVVEFDGVGVLEPSIGKGSGSYYDVGTHTLTYLATDLSGNTNSCTFDITVVDNEPPNCVARDITIYLDNSGNASIDETDIENGSTDNCGILGVSIDRYDFGCEDAYEYLLYGTTQTVQLTVTDIYNNASACTAEVTVLYSANDEDCDGVGDECDVCLNGDDSVDSNGDGLPDCANYPGPNDLDASWNCSNNANSGKVSMCHRPPGAEENFHTICVSENAVQTHIDHGDWVGPCVSCLEGAKKANPDTGEIPSMEVFPNPASDYIQFHFDGIEEGASQLSVINILGQVVWTKTSEDASDLHDYRLSVNDKMDSGLYMIVLSQENIKLVKQFIIN